MRNGRHNLAKLNRPSMSSYADSTTSEEQQQQKTLGNES